MLTLKTVGVLAHPLRSQTAPVAGQIANALREHGLDVWLYTTWVEDDVRAAVAAADLVIAIGGDGAMLRAARVCAPHGVPVLGVNMGQLGFLTEIRDPETWSEYIPRLLSGDIWIEERMMLRVSPIIGGRLDENGHALNDVVISGGVTRMIQLETFIDGDWATTYNADALIIATATGSTAYALAVGGPILPPELRNILIVPSAPHLSMSRPIVLAEGAVVDVYPLSSSRSDVQVLVDGVSLGSVGSGDGVRIQASEYVTRFVRTRERNYFYRSLLDRLEPRIPHEAPRSNHRIVGDDMQSTIKRGS